MSELNLDEIRERAEGVRTWKAVWGPPIPQLCDVDIPALIAEVEKLHGALALARGMLGDAARQIEEQTADVVSLGGTVDILTARCDQMERDHAETVSAEKRVRELHRPIVKHLDDDDSTVITVCVECDHHREICNDELPWSSESAKAFLWPCSTVRALDGGETP